MAMTESRRFELHGTLREKLGVDAADTLMAHLPPSGWDDVARIHHIDALRTGLEAELESLRGESLAEMHRLAAVQTRWIAGLLGSLVVAMIVALVR